MPLSLDILKTYTSNFANSEDTDECTIFIRVYTIWKGKKFFRQQLAVDKDNATVLRILNILLNKY